MHKECEPKEFCSQWRLGGALKTRIEVIIFHLLSSRSGQLAPVQMQPALPTICGTVRIPRTKILTIMAICLIRPI